MKSYKIISLLALTILVGGIAKAQHDPIDRGLNAITREAIKGQLDFLSSDWTEGRETTTKGEFMAGDFIAAIFQIYGLQPAGDLEGTGYAPYVRGEPMRRIPKTPGYFQNIPFVQTLSNESSIEIISKHDGVENKLLLSQNKDYYISGGPVNQEITSPIVFIGYGYKNDDIGYDDFKGLDVKGKIVLRISGYPGINDTNSVAYKKMNTQTGFAYSQSLRDLKAKLLKDHGVAGLITIPGYTMYKLPPANYPFRTNTPTFEGERKDNGFYLDISLPVDSASGEEMRISLEPPSISLILDGSGIDLKEFEKIAATKLKSGSKEIIGKSIHLTNFRKTQTALGRNVLARIEGENPNEVIVVGAHYDHLGMYNGYIYNGADDNASGTVGVMTLAKAFIASGVKPKKTIIFAAWTGEENGLLGSTYFVSRYPKKTELVLNLNLDMISRRPEKDTAGYKANLDYTQAYPILKDLVEKANSNYKLGLEMTYKPAAKPRGGTDFAPFAEKMVPIYSFFAAFTADYHGAMDHSSKADLDLMQKIIKAGYISLYELANSEGKIEPQK